MEAIRAAGMALPRVITTTGTATSTVVGAAAMVTISAVALLTMWGTMAAVGFRMMLAGSTGSGAAVSVEAPNPRYHGPQRFIVVVAYATFDPQLDPSQMVEAISAAPNSLTNFFRQNSYSQVAVVGLDGNPINRDDVFGPYQFTPNADADCVRGVAEAVAQVLKARQTPLVDGLRVMLFTPQSCGIGGTVHTVNLGDEVAPLRLHFAIEFVASASSVRGFPRVMAHEVGHLFGMGHGSYLPCAAHPSTLPDACDPPANYDWDHGSPYDVMGNGELLGHSSARLLQKATWLLDNSAADHRLLTVRPQTVPTDQTVWLSPINSEQGGLKAIRLPSGYTHRLVGDDTDPHEYLYLEWHTPEGLNTNIAQQSQLFPHDYFDGAILHITRESNPSLIHPTAEAQAYACDGYSLSQCPRKRYVSLPFGATYTLPNSGATLTLGPRPGPNQLLQVTINKLGRHDFDPPQGVRLTLQAQLDDCTSLLQAIADDPSGISKVEFYREDRASAWPNPEYLVATDTEAPFELPYHFLTLGKTIEMKVFDAARSQGGVADDNVVAQTAVAPGEYQACVEFPEVTISSPYLATPFTTKGAAADEVLGEQGKYRYYNITPRFTAVRSPVPITVTVESNYPLYLYTFTESEYYGDALDNLRKDSCHYQYSAVSDLCLFPAAVQSGNVATYAYSLMLDPYNPHPMQLVASSQKVDWSFSFMTTVDFDLNVLPPLHFQRGDANQDGSLGLSDAVQVLSYLFTDSTAPPGCLDAADTNDDGVVDIADAQYLLNYLFTGANAAPPSPNTCGPDPTPDTVGCASFAACSVP